MRARAKQGPGSRAGSSQYRLWWLERMERICHDHSAKEIAIKTADDMRRFFPIPFTFRDAALTLGLISFALLVLVFIRFSDPLASGALYYGSVLFGTII